VFARTLIDHFAANTSSAGGCLEERIWDASTALAMLTDTLSHCPSEDMRTLEKDKPRRAQTPN